MYLVFTRMPGGVIEGDSGLCCLVPCLLSAIGPLCCVHSTLVLSTSFCSRLQQFTQRLTCKCVYVCVYTLSQFRDQITMPHLEWISFLSYACIHLCRRVWDGLRFPFSPDVIRTCWPVELTVLSWIILGTVVCLYTPVSPSVPEMEGIYGIGGYTFSVLFLLFSSSFLEDVPWVEFMYTVFPRTPGGVTVDDSGLCYCVPRLLSANNSL